MTDFYKLGSGLGDSYLDGQKIARDRRTQDLTDAQTQAATDAQAANTARTRGLTEGEAYTRDRTRGFDAQYDASIAPGAGLPDAGAAAPGAADEPVAPATSKPRSPGDGHRALRDDALRRRDGAGYTTAHNAARLADADDAFKAGVDSADPDALVAANNRNLNGNPVTIHKLADSKGKVTGYEIITIRPDGSTSKVSASAAQLAQVAGFKAMMTIDPDRALQGISKIDADLATAFHVALKDKIDAVNANHTAVHNQAQDEIGNKNADNRLDIAAMRADTAALRLQYQREQKTMSPEDAQRLNELSAAVDSAPDDTVRAKAVGEFRRVMGIVLGKQGKVVPYTEKPQVDEKVNADGSITKGGKVYVLGKDGKFARPEGLEPSALERALSGNGSGVPPAKAKATGAGLPDPAVANDDLISSSVDDDTGRTVFSVRGVATKYLTQAQARAAAAAVGSPTSRSLNRFND